VEIVAGDTQGFRDRVEDLSHADDGIACVIYFRQQDHELVAALPADRVRAAHAHRQLPGDRL
jgi:hypothetical protein